MRLENFWMSREESEKRTNEEIEDFYADKNFSDKNLTEREYLHEQVPDDLIPTTDLFEKDGITLDEVHSWYAAAIISRRNREPLENDRFVSHFEGMSSDPTFAFGEKEKGYLLGCLKYGVFIPTHFAPKTMRGGYELIKRLGDSLSVPAVMSITEDLGETLSKMSSWKKINLNFLAVFRESLMEKQIVYNSHPDTQHLMLGLVSDYLEEAKDDI